MVCSFLRRFYHVIEFYDSSHKPYPYYLWNNKGMLHIKKRTQCNTAQIV